MERETSLTPYLDMAPDYIALAPSGDVYVNITNNHKVLHYTATGEWVGDWTLPGEPSGSAVAQDGDAYVVINNNGCVVGYSATGAAGGVVPRRRHGRPGRCPERDDRPGRSRIRERGRVHTIGPTRQVGSKVEPLGKKIADGRAIGTLERSPHAVVGSHSQPGFAPAAASDRLSSRCPGAVPRLAPGDEALGISGILVATRSEHVDECLRALRSVPGVDTHQVDSAAGRIVLTQEAAGLEAHTAGLRLIKDLPHVLFAELVYHVPEDNGPHADSDAPGRPSKEHGHDTDA